jgi:hypothetical protein
VKIRAASAAFVEAGIADLLFPNKGWNQAGRTSDFQKG